MEKLYYCPHCWQESITWLDPSVSEQEYVEDCQVCCNPLIFRVEWSGEVANLNVYVLDQ